MMASHYTQLQPVLYVADLAAEKAFYTRLGFTVKDETTTFVSVSSESGILFGLLLKPDFRLVNFNQQLVWQIGVRSVQTVLEICQREQLSIEEYPNLEDWGEWTMAVASPNGWRVVFEGGE